MNLKFILLILNVVAFFASLIWVICEKSWESFITLIGLIISLISLTRSDDNSKGNKISMKQKGGKGSKNYQAGGNIKL